MSRPSVLPTKPPVIISRRTTDNEVAKGIDCSATVAYYARRVRRSEAGKGLPVAL